MNNSDHDDGDGESGGDLSFLDRLPGDDSSFAIRPGSTRASFHATAAIPGGVVYGDVEPGAAPRRGKRAQRGKRSIGPLPPSGRLLLYDVINLEDERFEVMLSLFAGDGPDSYDVRGNVFPAPPENTQGRLSIDDKQYYAAIVEGSIAFKEVTLGGDIDGILFALETLE